MARCRSRPACAQSGMSPLAARVHPIRVEHEAADYSLRADSPLVPVGVENSTCILLASRHVRIMSGGYRVD